MSDAVRISVGSMTFDALVDGPTDGALVVLLHGFPETAHEWTHVIGPLADQGYRVVAPSTRGISSDARPASVDAYHVRLLTDDVLAIAASERDEPFHLVGHDWGALIAWHVAAHHPDMVRSLTSVSVPHPRPFATARREDADQQQRSSYIATFRTPEVGEGFMLDGDAAVLRAALAELDPIDASEHLRVLSDRAAMTAGLNYYRMWDDALDELPDVTVPTLYVWGTADPALGRTPAEATKDCVRAPYRFEVFEGVGHWIPEVAADRLVPLLLEHFESAS